MVNHPEKKSTTDSNTAEGPFVTAKTVEGIRMSERGNQTTEPVPIPAGALLTITTGEYSEYHIMGVFRAKQEIDHAACYKEYLQEHPKQAHPPGGPYGDGVGWNFRPTEFLGWLSRRGLLEPIDCFEWNLEWGQVEGVENLADG